MEGVYQDKQSTNVSNGDFRIFNVKYQVPVFIHIAELQLRALFGIAENIAIDTLLGTSFINGCIPGIYPAKPKSRPLEFEVSGDNH